MTVVLPPEIESRVKQEASRQGVPAEAYLFHLIEENLPTTKPREKTSLEKLFDKWNEEDATDDPEEIAKATRELEAFKQQMNQNRLDSEGPNARKLFP